MTILESNNREWNGLDLWIESNWIEYWWRYVRGRTQTWLPIVDGWLINLPTYIYIYRELPAATCYQQYTRVDQSEMESTFDLNKQESWRGARCWTLDECLAIERTYRILKGMSHPYSCKDSVPCPSLRPTSSAHEANKQCIIIIINYLWPPLIFTDRLFAWPETKS